jgi:hypothetical protein
VGNSRDHIRGIPAILDNFGYYSLVGPTGYWRPGESRTIRVSMPVRKSRDVGGDAHLVAICRDVRMRFLFAVTSGGASKRWRVATKRGRTPRARSDKHVWRYFFGSAVTPIDAKYAPMAIETVDRLVT